MYFAEAKAKAVKLKAEEKQKWAKFREEVGYKSFVE